MIMRSTSVLLAAAIALLHSASCDEKSDLRRTREQRLPHDRCGKTPMMLSKTIVGGKPAELGEFPWMALIGVTPINNITEDVFWGCGGTLITDQHVLTAAHCVHKSYLTYDLANGTVQFEVTKIRLGELDKDPNITDGANPIDYDVESVVSHEGFDTLNQVNDIAIVKLAEKVNFTDNVGPICLPPVALNDMTFVDEYPTIAGWGKTSMEDDEGSNMLMKVQVKVVKTKDCEKNLTAEYPYWKIDEKVICAGEEGRDSCQGDSGGPLMYFYQPEHGDDEGKHYIIGVVSYGYGCALPGYPGVYGRVSSYKNWILDHLD